MKYSNAQLLDFLNTATAADGPYDGAKLALFEDETPITAGAALADLQKAQYDGYADSAAVTWGTSHIAPNGSAVKQCIPKEFKATGDSTESIVTQVGLVNAAGDTLLSSYVLDEPLRFTGTSSVFLVGFPLILDQPSTPAENIVP